MFMVDHVCMSESNRRGKLCFCEDVLCNDATKNKPMDFCFPMMSARGCSFKCTFCYRMDPGYRKRDAKILLDEIEMLYKDYGINYIAFQDDLLMSSVSHTEEVCKEFLKRNLPIHWECS